MDYSSINYLALAVAGIASFMLGGLWYSPVLFAKTWQKEVGISEEELKNSNMVKVFGTSLVLAIIMAFGLALFMTHLDSAELNWKSGLHLGAFTGAFFLAPSMGMNYLYQRKSFTLWAIDAGYQVIMLALMGAILGAWH